MYISKPETKLCLLPMDSIPQTTDYLWGPIIRAAVLGQLGHQEEAENATEELLSLVADFGNRGRGLIHRMLFEDESVEMVAEGLNKAGVIISQRMN